MLYSFKKVDVLRKIKSIDKHVTNRLTGALSVLPPFFDFELMLDKF